MMNPAFNEHTAKIPLYFQGANLSRMATFVLKIDVKLVDCDLEDLLLQRVTVDDNRCILPRLAGAREHSRKLGGL